MKIRKHKNGNKRSKTSNVIKLQAPFERIKIYSSHEEWLFKAIITQAVIDATNISKCPQNQKIAQEARDWLLGDSEYFIEICWKSGICPAIVKKIAQKAITLSSPSDKNSDFLII